MDAGTPTITIETAIANLVASDGQSNESLTDMTSPTISIIFVDGTNQCPTLYYDESDTSVLVNNNCQLSQESLTGVYTIPSNLGNKNYKVYFSHARFTYKNANMMVQPNELIIAIKEE